MLRIKRSVQASYNTESSFIAAQTAAAKKSANGGDGGVLPTDEAAAAADPMAGLEREAASGGGGAASGKKPAPSFVASTLKKTNENGIDEPEEMEGGGEGVLNPEAIDIEDDDE